MFERFLFFRLIQIIFSLSPILIGLYRDKRRYLIFPKLQPTPRETHEKRAASLRRKLTWLGPTFIKFGQILSTREDFIPPQYILELSRLQDNVPPAPFRKIEKRLKQEFGPLALSMFDSIDPHPIASASLAQVHLAMLNGEKVALKILRPGVEEIIEKDLHLFPLIALIFQTFTALGKNNLLLNVISEFSRVIKQELDFVHEYGNMELFRKRMVHYENVVVPAVYPDYSTKRVLTMQHVEGIKISQVEEIERAGVDGRYVVDTLARCYIEQVLIHGFFHADPHPGNLLVTPQGKIVFLDFGMMVRIDRRVQRLIIKASIAGARRDIGELIVHLTELGILNAEENQEALKNAAKKLIGIFDRKEDGTRAILKLRQVLTHFTKVVHDFSFALPPYLVYLFKASGEVEMLCIRFIPEFTGIEYASPLVKEMMRDLIEEEQKALALQMVDKARQLLEMPFQMKRLLDEIQEERVRFKMHPQQIRQMEAIMAFNARRILFGILAGVISITTAILYLEVHSTLLLIVGFTTSSILGTGAITMPSRIYLEWKRQESDDYTP